jgi:sporulation protein YlmC with PRC-barrel domain
MKLAKPLLVSFSILAFAGANAYANEAKEQARDTQAEQPTQRSADMPWERDKGAAAGGTGTQAAQQRGELRASDLKGMEVVNAKGEEIGEIDDIVLDLNSGKVHAAVLGFGGFLGIAEDNYAFPLSELKPGKERNQVLMNVDKQALESRDGFSKSQWPGMDDAYWTRMGGKQAGAGSSPQSGKMNLIRSSELIGKEVQDRSGKKVGEVQDVVVGLQNGEVKNIVVSVQDGGRAMVPGKSIKASGTENRLVLDMSADQLKRN